MSALLNKFKIQTYNVGIIKKDINCVLGDNDNQIVWLKHKYKDRFFADPFLIKQDKDYYYLLVEEYPFRTEKGVISLLTVTKADFKLVDKKVVIEEPYHLSFPFCFENGKTIIPESSRANETYAYTFDIEKMAITNKTKVINEGLIDGVYYEDYLFASKITNPKTDLYCYKKSNKDLYEPCNKDKPIISSLEYSRSAGLFFNCNGELYRPAQDCAGRYGRRVMITKIKDVSDNRLDFECTKIIDSFNYPPFNETMHTFNVYDGFVIVDGSKDFLRFPMKLFYKLRKRLFSRSKA